MRKFLILSIIVANFLLIAGEFDLFKEQSGPDPAVFQDFKFNKFRFSYSLYPVEQKKAGLSFTRFLGKKLGFTVEYDQTETGSDLNEKSELIVAATYKFTKRSWTWLFLGDLGLSINDDVKDFYGASKGFRANHIFGRFSAEYIFRNGLGFDFSMSARMTLETGVDEEISPIHSIGILYQF